MEKRWVRVRSAVAPLHIVSHATNRWFGSTSSSSLHILLAINVAIAMWPSEYSSPVPPQLLELRKCPSEGFVGVGQKAFAFTGQINFMHQALRAGSRNRRRALSNLAATRAHASEVLPMLSIKPLIRILGEIRLDVHMWLP